MKNKIFGKKKVGKGLIITGGLLTVIGAIGAIASKFNNDDNDGNYGSINVCEDGKEKFNNEFLEDCEDTEIEIETEIETEIEIETI